MRITEPLRVHSGKLHYFVREALKRLRVPRQDASRVAEALVFADLTGAEGEGVARLPYHVGRLSAGLVNPTPNIRVASDRSAAATLDGDNGLGPVVATRAMELALEKAGSAGAAVVVARRSNHFGSAGYYARLALERDMVGIAMSNAFPSLSTPGGGAPVVGAGALAVAAPAVDESPFVLDLSLSAGSIAAIEDARRQGEPIPTGWAFDPSGKRTTDAEAALEALHLSPLGGDIETGGHKGFGLAVAVDVLCGILSGGAFGPELQGAWGSRPGPAQLGQFFLALKIGAFGPEPDFRKRMDQMLRGLMKSAASGGAAYAGRRAHESEMDRRANDILLAPETATALLGLARQLDLREPWDQLISGRGSR